MRTIFIVIILLLSPKLFAQTIDESNLFNLSRSFFKLEVENNIDSLETILHEKFVAVSSTGSIQNKSQYTDRLKNGNFVHNRIDIEESKVTLSENTATVIGKGKFTITVSGTTNTLHLSYMLVFTRSNPDNAWKLLALKANALEK